MITMTPPASSSSGGGGGGGGGGKDSGSSPSPSAATSTSTSTRTGSGGSSTLSSHGRPSHLRRRSRSKGTIAGFASSQSSRGGGGSDHPPHHHSDGPTAAGSLSPTHGTDGGPSSSSSGMNGSAGGGGGSGGGDSSSTNNPDGTSNQPQHQHQHESSSDSASSPAATRPPAKPCHSARMTLLCIQNAMYMGARTQVSLCPPGRSRSKLWGVLSERRRRNKLLSAAADSAGGGAGASSSSLSVSVSVSSSRPGLVGRNSSVSSSGTGAGGSSAALLLSGSSALSSSRILHNPDDSNFNIERMLGEAGLAEYDAAEGECLDRGPEYLAGQTTDGDGEDLIEDPSSGDEDDLDLVDCPDEEDNTLGRGGGGGGGGSSASADAADRDSRSAASLGRGKVHQREPLYTPAGSDPSTSTQQSAGGGSAGIGGSAASGKIPFNHRKLRWFDAVAASDRGAARAYLRKEMNKLRRRDGLMLVKHLRRVQRRERRLVGNSSASLGSGAAAAAAAAAEAVASASDDDESEDAALENLALAAGVTGLPDDMTSSLSAALVLESLSLTPLESLEGMSKCYDAIVAAGTALLDAELDNDPTATAAQQQQGQFGGIGSGDDNDNGPATDGEEGKRRRGSSSQRGGGEAQQRRSESEIMNALAPVLITTLEHPSGEAILGLARLRRMCGTGRYRRRFVQRVAPALIRPPNAALWCLRHQNDMEAILAAAEMILDGAFEVFSAGWHERGRLILADSVRAETLRTAADQLKRLSAPQSSDCLITGLMTMASGGGLARLHHGSRGSNALMMGTTTTKEGGGSGTGGPGGSHEPLAEWEVLAVDVEIRRSINNLFTRDWSRAIVVSAVPPRDDGSVAGSVGSHRLRRGISSAKTKPMMAAAAADSASVESSGTTALVLAPPSSLMQPPPSPAGASSMSPRGGHHHKAPLPLSPPSQPSTPSSQSAAAAQVVTPTPDALESVFGPSFVTSQASGASASAAIDSNAPHPNLNLPSVTAPGSPSAASRKPGYREQDTAKTVIGTSSSVAAAGALTPPHTPSTPPRSPPREAEVIKEGSLGSAPQLPSMSPGGSELRAPVTPVRTSSHALVHSTHSPAPLSPMSIGAVSYSSMDSASQRLTGGASVSSTGSGTGGGSHQQSSAQTAYLRTLTSTAAERKRTVAACRALRAQISRFEEAFVQLHGRPPKGAAERAPLATTYAQYREWKRAIRADAAGRIQALFRGARVRWMLLRSNNPRMSRVVLTRAGRPEFVAPAGPPEARGGIGGGARNSLLNNISIPVEIGGRNDSDDNLAAAPSLTQRSSSAAAAAAHGHSNRLAPPGGAESNDGAVEVVMPPAAASSGPPPTAPSLTPSWSANPSLSMHKQRRSSREEPSSGGSSLYSPGGGLSTSSSRSPVSNLTFGGVHINDLPLPELQARKRELKQQLKQYDMNFARQHGRMPVKAEKEPIRHLYESYNALKSRITYIEREGVSPSGGPPMPYRRSSADRATGLSTASITSDNSSGDDSPGEQGPAIARAKRKDNKSPPTGAGPTAASSGPSTPTGAPSHDLAALKAEKGQLHQMLRSYEKDFFKLHNRQVSSFADIRPVASQYRRYKEIKKKIAEAQLQQGEK